MKAGYLILSYQLYERGCDVVLVSNLERLNTVVNIRSDLTETKIDYLKDKFKLEGYIGVWKRKGSESVFGKIAQK